MLEFYSTHDYRRCLRLALDRLELRGERISNQALAEAMRVQSPYLSKVFSGSADLSEDQLFLAARKLKLSEDEHRYVALLLVFSRASLKERKAELLLEIEAWQNRKLSPSENRSAPQIALGNGSETELLSRYYLDPWAQIIHMYLTIPKWLKDPRHLVSETRIEASRLADILKTLEELEIIEFKSGVYRLLKDQLHLSKKSVLCGPQQNLMRTLSLSKTANAPADAYSFLATFTANEKTRLKIQAEFVNFLKNVETLVQAAPSEDVYQIQFDLFSWS